MRKTSLKLCSDINSQESGHQVTKREARRLEPERNYKLLAVQNVIDHMREFPEIKPEDFLKEDFVSSPKFKQNPKTSTTQN